MTEVVNDRDTEFILVKGLMKANIAEADCGLFNTPNIAGDRMYTLFRGKYFQLDHCPSWEYYEVFGCTPQEWQALNTYYGGLQQECRSHLWGDNE